MESLGNHLQQVLLRRIGNTTMTSHAVSTAQRVLKCYARFSYHVSVPIIYSMIWLL